MATEIWVALITLVGTLIGTFSGIVVGTKLINYRIEQLEKKVFTNWNKTMRSILKKSGSQITELTIWKNKSQTNRQSKNLKKDGIQI